MLRIKDTTFSIASALFYEKKAAFHRMLIDHPAAIEAGKKAADAWIEAIRTAPNGHEKLHESHARCYEQLSRDQLYASSAEEGEKEE